MTSPFKVITLIGLAAIAALAADPVPNEKSLPKEAAEKIAVLEKAEEDATAKLQAVASLILTPLQQQQQEIWISACKDAGFPLAECRPDPKRRVVTRVKPEESKPAAK